MKHSFQVGFSFGSTSGIITTLGLMVGLQSGTHSKTAVLGGILTIAIADAFSDALGIHISEESENKHTPQEIWVATLTTFFSKFIFASLFIIPVLFFELNTAVNVSIVVGILIMGVLSYFMAKGQKENPWKIIGEHVIIAIIVVATTHEVGSWIRTAFPSN